MLRPLLDAMVAAMTVTRETGAAMAVRMERAATAVLAAMKQIWAMMVQVQGDLGVALRELYQMLERATKGKSQ